MPIVIVTLVMVLLNPNHSSDVRSMGFYGANAMQDCKAAEMDAREAVRQSGSIDVGTICLESRFDDNVKPRV